MRRTGLRFLLVFGLLALATRDTRGQGFPASESADRMTMAEGLTARLFASEPLVRQPVAIEFDDRGRLWVIQYMQYPNPAGLNRVRVDRYSRTAYDRVPEPPPRGPKGNDRITILEDTDGDGRADRSHDFLSNLNLASGLAFGDGGVYVLQAPYLLFYPDRDGNDQPDGDPEVLLTGFGMEDAHSVANSLTWGPDGWLYGCQGSTVTARIRDIEFQQGIWRYHPPTRRFELYLEGGGNMWGLDFDRAGNLLSSTNHGGYVALHGLQGAYYWKQFGKHGPLHNPYTFGFFHHVTHDGLKGGHVSNGGLFYEADLFPSSWRGRYIANDLLDHSIHWHTFQPKGSTFQGHQGGDFLRANDTWFAPSDLTLGPDGAVYVADWHDKRTAHPDPDADWDRSNGRIYRIIPAKGTTPGTPKNFDLKALSNEQLLALRNHPNAWHQRRGRRILSERQARDQADSLRREVLEARGPKALEALWLLNGINELDAKLMRDLLKHPDAAVRGWVVRLIGDAPLPDPGLRALLPALAKEEPGVHVRAQLACTAQRLDTTNGLDVAEALLRRDLDREDPFVPLLIWWAIERHAIPARESLVRRFAHPELWRSDLARVEIMPRLVHRFAAERTPEFDRACAQLLADAPADEDRIKLASALVEPVRERPKGSIAPELVSQVSQLVARHPTEIALTRLAYWLGSQSAADRVKALALDSNARESDRVAMLEALGESGDQAVVDLILELATAEKNSSVRTAALQALGHFDAPRIAERLLQAYSTQQADWQGRTRELLLGRATWARLYLARIDQGNLSAKDVSIEQVGRIALLNDPELDELAHKHWGTNRGATPEEKLAEVRRLNNDLRAAAGNQNRGKLLFKERCSTCHRLNGEGNLVGPELSFANRKDRDYLLVSLVDPSGVVRKEYQSFIAQMRDGRVVTGLIVEQTPDTLTFRDAKGEAIRVARKDVEELKESNTSLMPESLYRELSPSQLRDLFSYLQGK